MIRRDLAKCLGRGWTPQGSDLVYIDPPCSSSLLSLAHSASEQRTWLNPDALVICEHPSDATIEPPQKWLIKDRRRYGIGGPVAAHPPEHHRGGTGSLPLRTDPAA